MPTDMLTAERIDSDEAMELAYDGQTVGYVSVDTWLDMDKPVSVELDVSGANADETETADQNDTEA